MSMCIHMRFLHCANTWYKAEATNLLWALGLNLPYTTLPGADVSIVDPCFKIVLFDMGAAVGKVKLVDYKNCNIYNNHQHLDKMIFHFENISTLSPKH